MSAINYFDWYDVFVNQISGSETIFIFISFIAIAAFCIKMKFPNIVTLTIFAVYSLIMAATFRSLLAITITLISFFLAWNLSRLLSRG